MMSRTMTEAPLPKRVDGVKLVDNNQELTGNIDSEQLERLGMATVRCEVPIHCNIKFERDNERNKVLSGNCKTSVVMTCQRCLGEVSIDIEGDFTLGLVFNDEQAKKLPRRYEPVVLGEEGQLQLWDVIEDEVLLCLPDFPKHSESECQFYKIEADETHEDVKRENPFDVLAQLKQK